ncbi:MAG: hypothetical protein NXY57DRAFT_967637 [Lentinula lateritia]|nr:MAG: hypothetical protein NXY57DRAFT_967637 [Lentinula lateritia]
MASSSSQTRTGASSTLLPTSLAEAQELIAGLKSKSSTSFLRERFNSPDHDSSKPFPAFSYPSALVPFCFPPGSSRHLSVASGLDLFCSARIITQILHPLIEASDSLDSGEAFNAFEEAAPFLTYIHDFWIGRTNCPLFAEHVLRTADGLFQHLPAFLRDSLEQQWGIPFNHQSSFLGPSDFKQFPVIPIPFCLRFREGSAMMHLASPKDLDPFVSLCSSMTETCLLPGGPRVPSPVEDSFESSEENQSVAPPKRNKRKRELASLMADASTILDRRSNIKLPLKEDRPVLPKASSSKKKVEKPVLKPKATARSKTTVKVVEESQVSPESEELATPSYQIKCVRLPPRLRQAAKGKARQMEVLDVEESNSEEEVLSPPPKRLKSSKTAPETRLKALLLSNKLNIPDAPLQRQNPIFDVNPEFLDLGVILTTQKASFTMQDLLQINPCNPCAGLHFSLVSRRVQSELISFTTLDVDLAMDALNALHVATTSSTLNLTNSLRRTQELRTQLDRLGAHAGQDPIVVLKALKAAEPQCESLSVEDWTLLATLFQWSSPFNLNGIHSDTSSAEITPDGHLAEALQPPEPAVPITVVEKALGVENLASLSEGSSIQADLDLPQIESLIESTPSPERGI